MLYASPTGKSTLADSLFNTSFDSTAESHSEAGVKLKAHTYELQVRATLDCALIDGFSSSVLYSSFCTAKQLLNFLKISSLTPPASFPGE